MDNQRIGSLNSLADYGLGESDIEDSDDEVEPENKPIVAARPSVSQVYVKTSARLVSYDDEEEKGEELKDEVIDKDPETVEETVSDEKVIDKDVTDEDSSQEKNTAQASLTISDSSEMVQSGEKDDSIVEDLTTETSNSITDIKMPQLPPEPTGRCSNALQDKIRSLLEKTHQEKLDLNTNIQNRKDYRNPSIYKKLLQFLNIDETGSNYPKSLFDPTCWPEESYYESLSKAQKEAYERKEKEKAKQARTQVEFVSGTKKSGAEEPKKRKSKWDVSAAPAPPVKTATPPVKVGAQGSVVSSSIDISAAKKPKVS